MANKTNKKNELQNYTTKGKIELAKYRLDFQTAKLNCIS